MNEYGLIAAADPAVAVSYSEAARLEGLEPILTASAQQARRVLAQRGVPRAVVASIDTGDASTLSILREVQGAAPGGTRPPVVAAVARELRTTVGDLRESLGIVELLPARASQHNVRLAIRRALSRTDSTITDLRPPPSVMTDLPTEDPEGVAALLATNLLDHLSPEQQLAELVGRTCEVLKVAAAVVTLSIDGFDWCHTHVSAPERRSLWRGAGREQAFCAHVVSQGQPTSIDDLRLHPEFSAHPLVTSGAISTMAGAPLQAGDGEALGALCILDDKPAVRPSDRLDLLARIAARFAGDIEVRSQARSTALEVVRLNDKLSVSQAALAEAEAQVACLEALFSGLDDGLVLMNARREIVYVNEAASAVVGVSREIARRMSGDHLAATLARHVDVEGEGVDRRRELAFAPPPFAAEIRIERPRPRQLRWRAKALSLPSGAGELFVLTELPIAGAYAERASNEQAAVGGLRSTRVVKKRR